MELTNLTIIIVTYKSEEKVRICLNSISNKIPVIIVENSNDNNFKREIEKNYNNVNCILSGENKGYSTANNIGLNKVKTKYALVLNPDTILEKNSIKNFLETAEKFKDFWLIGPGNDQNIKSKFTIRQVTEVDNLKGFAIFFNMSNFNKKFFDENFFLFFEEIDLCKTVKKKKGKIYLDKNIIINHEGGSSVDSINSIKLEKSRNWHWMWSTFYFKKKHSGFFFALILIMPKFLSSIIKAIFYFLILNKIKRDIYFCRLSGMFNSIIGKKSWYRPSED